MNFFDSSVHNNNTYAGSSGKDGRALEKKGLMADH